MGELGSAQRISARLERKIARGVVGAHYVGLPPVMSSPPTFTAGASGAATTFSTPYTVTNIDPALRYLGGDMQVINDAQSGLNGWITNKFAFGNPVSYGYTLEFETDASALEMWLQNAVRYELVVDGQVTDATPRTDIATTDGNKYKVKIDFGSRKPSGRHLLFRFMNQSWFGGIYIDRRDTVWKTRRPKGPRVAVIGDSQSIGTGALATYRGFANVACRALGWEDVWVCGIGGTGYMNPGSYSKYRDHAITDISPYQPDIIWITGGQNDEGTAPWIAGVQNEATLLVQQLRAAVPKATFIISGPFHPTGTPTSAAFQVRDAAKAAALALDVPFIDVFGGTVFATPAGPPRWIVGSGKVGSTSGVGNSDYYISGDGTHYSDDGHAYIGVRLAGEIARAMQA